MRQPSYSRLAGYEDVNDAERLRVDPVMRHVVGGCAVDRDAASPSQVARFETDVLCHPDNLDALMAMPGQWVDRIRRHRPIDQLILDMDSSVSPTYGRQEGTAYNGRFGYECYHPLFLFNQDRDRDGALLRCGNVAGDDEWRSVLEPVVARYRDWDIPKYFRGDAAFALPELYSPLGGETYEYAIRLKSNAVLERQIEYLLTRPVGRPPKKDRQDTWEWYIKDTDRRTLPLTADMVKLLVELQMSQPEGNPYVFVPMARYEHIQELRRAGQWSIERGRSPLSKFCHHFNKVRKLAGIETGTFHDLRRTCLSNWVAQGLSLHEAKELAGHASIETTERFYLAVRKDVVDRARAASEASRTGHFVVRLLLAPDKSDETAKLPCVSTLLAKA